MRTFLAADWALLITVLVTFCVCVFIILTF